MTMRKAGVSGGGLSGEEWSGEDTCGLCGKHASVRFFAAGGEWSRSRCIECDLQVRLDVYARSGELDRTLASAAMMRRIDRERERTRAVKSGVVTDRETLLDEVDASWTRINNAAKRCFEMPIWFGKNDRFGVDTKRIGLQRLMKKERGMSATLPSGIKVLVYSLAGRAGVTISQPDASGESGLSLITNESSKVSCMGIMSMHATESRAMDMLSAVIAAWIDGSLVFKSDREVRLAGT